MGVVHYVYSKTIPQTTKKKRCWIFFWSSFWVTTSKFTEVGHHYECFSWNHLRSYFDGNLEEPLYELQLRFLVQVWLLAMCTVELFAVIT